MGGLTWHKHGCPGQPCGWLVKTVIARKLNGWLCSNARLESTLRAFRAGKATEIIWPGCSSFTRLETKALRNMVTHLGSHSELEAEAPPDTQCSSYLSPSSGARALPPNHLPGPCEFSGVTASTCRQPGTPGCRKSSDSQPVAAQPWPPV